ncbi:Ras family protein, partial [Ancylostoma duodenale]
VTCLFLCHTSNGNSFQSSFDTLRPLSYPDADVFIIVYSVVDPQSFAEIPSHWLPEINRANPIAQCATDLTLMFDSAILAALEGRRTIKSPRPQMHTSKLKQSFHRIMSITRKLI